MKRISGQVAPWEHVLTLLLLAASFANASAWASAGPHYVDVNSANPAAPYLTPATAARSIQDAVNAGDGCVDRADVAFLMNSIRTHSQATALDLNGDGKVDVADARFLVLHFTKPGGANCDR